MAVLLTRTRVWPIWNPDMPQQSGGYKILPTATGVWFATDGERFGHEYRRGIRFAPLP